MNISPLASASLVDYVVSSLPRRHYQVLQLLIQGYRNGDIAKELKCSDGVVKNCIHGLGLLNGIVASTDQHQVRIGLVRKFSLLTEKVGDGTEVWGSLTPRERRIGVFVLANLTNKAIATKIGITEDLVEKHLVNIFNRTGTSTRLELVVWHLAHF